MNRIIADTCKRFEVSRRDLMGNRRTWVICWPRFIAIRLIYDSLPCCQQSLAVLFDVTQQAISNAIQVTHDIEDTSAHGRSDLIIMRERLGMPAKEYAMKGVSAKSCSYESNH